MITRGIITYSDSSKIKVYIPILDGKVEEEDILNKTHQGTEVSSILSIPGLEINYKIGDIVLIGFEDNDSSSPVILGYLKSAITENTDRVSLTVQDLNVKGDLNAPSQTNIFYQTVSTITGVLK